MASVLHFLTLPAVPLAQRNWRRKLGSLHLIGNRLKPCYGAAPLISLHVGWAGAVLSILLGFLSVPPLGQFIHKMEHSHSHGSGIWDIKPLIIFQVPNLHWCHVQTMCRYFQQWGMEPSLPGEVRGGQLHWKGGNPKLFGFIQVTPLGVT